MAEVYGATPTAQRLATHETQVGLFIALLTALAELLTRIPGLALPTIPSGINTWAEHGRDRFHLQVTGIAGQLAWARTIGATEMIVRRGQDDPDAGGSGYVHLFYLGTVSGIPVCVWGGADELAQLTWRDGMTFPVAVLETGLARAEMPHHLAVGEAYADYRATLTPADPS